jgi:cytochrome b pre-mRNA-processing protein 3
MILPLFRRPSRSIDALYGAIVAQARMPVFYAELGVPDTVLGRFDMVLLHVVLVLRRLRREGARAGARAGADAPAERALAQGLFDRFCRDMDHNLREMGISDQGVPRHMQRVGEAFYGRAQVYEAALSEGAGEGALAQALARNVYLDTADGACAASLARYVRDAVQSLDEQSLSRGEVRFPTAEFRNLPATK